MMNISDFILVQCHIADIIYELDECHIYSVYPSLRFNQVTQVRTVLMSATPIFDRWMFVCFVKTVTKADNLHKGQITKLIWEPERSEGRGLQVRS